MFRRCWEGSRVLTATAIVMAAALTIFAAGLVLDARVVGGAPVWMKPAKFAVSIAVYTLTLAWIFSHLGEWRRTRRTVEWTTAVAMFVEMAIITGQAFRGTTSHFNVGSLLDGLLFTVMGATIVLQTLTSIAVAGALWQTSFVDRALGWALRFAMVITIAGASIGGMMTRPTDDQLRAARAGAPMTIAGAHTVGAADGGPGLPGTGWSTEHGDLRVAHFAGLHALQVLPVFALVLARRGVNERIRVHLTMTASASYVALVGLLLWQALRGQSVLAPDVLTLTAATIWALLTVGVAAGAFVHSSTRAARAVTA